MKHTNIRMLTALALGGLLAVTTLNAQEKPAKRERPEGAARGEAGRERMAKVAEELGLTAEQKTKLQAVIKEQAEKRQGLRDATPEERQAKVKAMREEINKQVKEILTAEQYAKWEKMRPAPGQRPGGPAGERRRPAGDKPAAKE